MSEQGSIEQVVERVITQVLERHVPQLREEIARSVLAEIAPLLGTPAASPVQGEGNTENLLKAVAAIHRGTTQREILRALLDNTVRYSGRTALFVIKGGTATGWEGRGFANNEEIKSFSLDVNAGVASRALEGRMPFAGTADEMDSNFTSKFGVSGDQNVLVLPLLLKDKVAAILYVDAGSHHGHVDPQALELLVNSTSAWLEVASLRKQAMKEGATDGPPAERVVPPVQSVSSFSDPFAGHAPIHSAAVGAPPVEAEASSSVTADAAAETQSGEVGEPVEEHSNVNGDDPIAKMPPEQAEVHRKAQRFARLLVDEIKLYNQAKVSDGRKNRDLYDRLKEDIEKSRATYSKRYGNTAASGADYFSNELVRSLAADDSSLMGANFRR
jgi:hypothetical protein